MSAEIAYPYEAKIDMVTVATMPATWLLESLQKAGFPRADLETAKVVRAAAKRGALEWTCLVISHREQRERIVARDKRGAVTLDVSTH